MGLNPIYFVDFDGTITAGDLSSELAAYFGGSVYMDIEKKYRQGEIPIRTWLQSIAEILPADMELLLEKTLKWAKIRSGFDYFLKHAKKQGSPVFIASDGFGFYIEPVMKKYGFWEHIDAVYRNKTAVGPDHKLKVYTPYAHPVCIICGNCKAAHVVRAKEKGRPVIYIGDGSNDRFGASWSDHVCARDRLAQSFRKNNFNYSQWYDFYDIIKVETPGLKDCSESALCSPLGSGVNKNPGNWP
ncbi:MAG: MtnX-like HAD-IB family phosphatase [Bacillota bacterium]